MAALNSFVVLLAIGAYATAAGILEAQAPNPQASRSAEATEVPITLPNVELSSLEPEIAAQLNSLSKAAEEAVTRGDAPAIADALTDLARNYHAYGFLDAAISAYAIATSVANDDRVFYLLAQALRESGDRENSLVLFAGVAQRQPNYGAARYYQALSLYELGRFEDARLALTGPASEPDGLDTPELDPENQAKQSPAVAVLLGQLALEAGNPRLAASWFEAAVQAAPEANRTHYLLAQAYRALGDTERAREAMSHYGPVGVRPSDPLMDDLQELRVGSTPFALRGRKAFAAGQFEVAASEFRQALDARPDDPGAMVNLASALAKTGDSAEAARLLEKSLQVRPNNATAHFNLGTLLTPTDPGAAAVHLGAAVRMAPGDYEARRAWVRLLAQIGRQEEALEAFEPLFGAPSFTEADRLLEIQLLIDTGQFETARQRLDDALRADPSSGLVAHTAARFLAAVPDLSLRDGARAVDLAQRVYAVAPDIEHATTLALALAETGSCVQASELLLEVRGVLREQGKDVTPTGAKVLVNAARGASCRP